MKTLIFLWLGAVAIFAQSTVSVNPSTKVLTQPTASQFYSANPPPSSSGTITLTGSVTGTGSSTIATTIANVPWSTLTGSLTAGGDLQGTYPNPSVNRVQGILVASGVANALGNLPNASGGFITFSGGSYQTPLTFGPNLLLTGTNVNVNGTTGTGSFALAGSPTFTGTVTSPLFAGNLTGTATALEGMDSTVVVAIINPVNGPSGLVQLDPQGALIVTGNPSSANNGTITFQTADMAGVWQIGALQSPVITPGEFVLVDAVHSTVPIIVEPGAPTESFTIEGDGTVDILGNLTVDGNIDLADHYFEINSTTGFIDSAQGYFPFRQIVEAQVGLTVQGGLSSDTISGDGSGITISGNALTGLFDGTTGIVEKAVDSFSDGLILHGTDGSTSGIAAFQAAGSFSQAIDGTDYLSPTGSATLTNKSISAGQVNSGVLAIGQIPTGTSSSTVAIGNDSRITGAAPLASPTFTGTPAAPTASVSTNTTQIATTAYVRANIVRSSGTLSSGTATVTVTSGAHPWVQDTGSSITNVGSLQVTVSSTTATVRSTNVLDTSTFDLFYVTP